MSFARGFVVVAAALGVALATTVHAQQPLRRVELSWQGPADCASAEDVLAQAGALLEPGREPKTTVRVVAVITARDDGALLLQWNARGEDMSAQRTMALASCAEARQAAALLIAMALSPDGQAGARDQRSGGVERDPTTPAKPAPARERSGLWLGLASGLDLQALPAVMIVGSARVGVRWNSWSLELDGFYGLPTTRQSNGVELTMNMFAIGALGCRGVALGRWELDACAGLELLRASVKLEGADAGAESWLRLAVEPRAALWLLPELAVGFSARVLIAPDPADFSNAAGDHAQAPTFGVLPVLGITWHPL